MGEGVDQVGLEGSVIATTLGWAVDISGSGYWTLVASGRVDGTVEEDENECTSSDTAAGRGCGDAEDRQPVLWGREPCVRAADEELMINSQSMKGTVWDGMDVGERMGWGDRQCR